MKKTITIALACGVVLALSAAYSPAGAGVVDELARIPDRSPNIDNGALPPTTLVGPVALVFDAGWSSTTSIPPAFFWGGTLPTPIDDGPFTFAGSGCVSVTDDFLKGDQFQLFDFGAPIGTTPGVPLVSASSVGPDAAYADPTWSSGTFPVGPGAHSITIEVIAGYATGQGYIRLDSPGTTLCPATLEAIEAKLDALEPQVTDIKAEVTDIKAESVDIKAEITDLKAETTDIKAELTDVKAETVDIKAELVDIKAETVDLKAEVVDIVEDLERARLERISKACMDKKRIALFYLPEANGGLQSTVATLVADTIAAVAASGENTINASYYKSQGDVAAGFGQHKRAYRMYCTAYCVAVNETNLKCIQSW